MKEYLYNLATDKCKGFFASLLKSLLLLASFIYGALIRGLMLFFSLKPARLNCKVISIGNITLGGTGKTSLVQLIACYLRDKGHKVAVLSRGYKKPQGAMGDEPLMLLKGLVDIPVIVDRDRIKAAKKAIEEYNADTVILDDGMQQWRIKKDLEIVTVNAVQGFGNGHMLPRGILRQPLSSLKRTADIFVLTKTDLACDLDDIRSFLDSINPRAKIVESVHRVRGFYDVRQPAELLEAGSLKGRAVAIFSGIGDPDSFAALIARLGINIGLDLRFSDHHNYSKEDLSTIAAKADARNLQIIVTTEKDASRLSDANLEAFGAHRVLVLRITLEITKNEGQLFTRLLSLYSL